MKTNPQFVNGYKSSRYVTKIRRDNYARRLIWWAFRRWCLNEDYYRVVIRFTGPRPRGTNQASTVKANAHSFRYYIEARHAGPWGAEL
jgi:hypothetical protein